MLSTEMARAHSRAEREEVQVLGDLPSERRPMARWQLCPARSGILLIDDEDAGDVATAVAAANDACF